MKWVVDFQWIKARWKRIVVTYAVLLLASFAMQTWLMPGPEPTDEQKVVTYTDGFGQTIDLAYNPIPFDESVAVEDIKQDQLPVILLHGSPGDTTNFVHLQPMLAATGRQTYTLDLPGFGNSTKWLHDYSPSRHADDLIAFMDALNIQRAHLWGFSMAGGLGFHAIDRYPERIASFVSYGGTGTQETEQSGDYYFEKMKYGIGYGLMVALPEFIPHFGLLGPRHFRNSFIRNFYDMDLRPIRAVMQSMDTPLLILHGRHDFLVPDWAAYEHHELVEHSELVMFDASHFMVFSEDSSRLLAEETIPFLERHDDPTAPPMPRTLDHTSHLPDEPPILPVDLHIQRDTSPWLQAGAIIVATWILEDPTTIATGLLVRDGQIDWAVAIIALFLGIVIGDLALYAFGWFVGRRVLQWGWVRRGIPVERAERMGEWFDRHGWTAVLASRFVPGTRLPLYTTAGATGTKPWRFLIWTMSAVAIWTVVMFLLVITIGEAAASPFKLIFGDSWLAFIAAIVLLIVIVRYISMLFTPIGRSRLRWGWQKLYRWEFWPSWLLYLPLLPYLGWLAIRHGGPRTITAVNPLIKHSGIVDESKVDIMQAIPDRHAEHILEVELIPAGTLDERRALIEQHLEAERFEYPFILKPNDGYRGTSVKIIQTAEDIARYLQDVDLPLVMQRYHPGPFEAGLFYVRYPEAEAGELVWITDKHFSSIVGDGQLTLLQHILRHPRYRMQAKVFAKRFKEKIDDVVPMNQRIRLAEAGNHCQGTEFRDGSQLITPELSAALDRVAKDIPDFYFGRFDVRYTNPAAFAEGTDFAIIELNGVTSEATNIYDPDNSLLHAYRVLAKQWQYAFEIGHANRKAGTPISSYRDLLRDLWRNYRARRSSTVAD